MIDKETNQNLSEKQILKTLSSQDFLNLGIQDLAYIRPICVDNKKAYAIHAADGTPLSIIESFDSAVSAVRHHDLEPVTVH